MKIKKPLILRLLGLTALAIILLFTGCSPSSGSSTGSSALPLDAPASYPSADDDPETANFTRSAINFVGLLDAGWNLGNTLDAYSGSLTGVATETSWGQPTTTRAMMTGLKNSGIKTVRIPVTWHNHVDGAFTIDPVWMTRVKEVVDFAIAEDLYVIINIHHDNEEDYYFPNLYYEARSTEYVKRVWKQIALTFRNYDEHLIFEILNEPRLVGYSKEWVWSDSDSKLVEAAGVINRLEQAGLDEIRATGSNNTNRYVMITPYVASPSAAVSSHFGRPTDTATDKLILSVHAYTPYVFAMQAPGDITFTTAHQNDINHFMDSLKTKFIDGESIPVIIGEYGATNKNNLSERVKWFSYYCDKAASYGMSTILWDNGNYLVPSSGSFNELYGFYNRTAQTWYFHDGVLNEDPILDEIIEAYTP